MKLVGVLSASALFLVGAIASAAPADPSLLEAPKHEILLGVTQGSATLSNANLNASLEFGYNHTASDHWQLGVFPFIGFGYGSDGVGVSYTVGAFVGPTLNFSDDIVNSFFLRGLVGVSHASLASQNYSETTFGAQALFGKRFNLFGNVEYTPSVGVSQSFRSGSTLSFVLNFLSLSATF